MKTVSLLCAYVKPPVLSHGILKEFYCKGKCYSESISDFWSGCSTYPGSLVLTSHWATALEVVLKSKDELYATLKNTENLNSQITLKELKYPVKKGDIIGVIKYFTETGQVIGSVDVISANDINNASLVTKIKMIFTD